MNKFLTVALALIGLNVGHAQSVDETYCTLISLSKKMSVAKEDLMKLRDSSLKYSWISEYLTNRRKDNSDVQKKADLYFTKMIEQAHVYSALESEYNDLYEKKYGETLKYLRNKKYPCE